MVLGMRFFGPHGTLDERLFYSGIEARFYLDTLSDSEMRAYLFNELADLVLIGLYSSLLFLSLRHHFPKRVGLHGFAFIPGFFDLIETCGILYALTFEGSHAYLDNWGAITLMKWLTGIVAMGLTLFAAFCLRSKSYSETATRF